MPQTRRTTKGIQSPLTSGTMRTHKLLTFWLRTVAAVLLLFVGTQAARSADEFLDPEVAFKLEARALDDRTLEVTVTAVPGYYLYREQFKFEALGVVLGTPVMPPGKTKFDETFQKNVETYRDAVHITIPVQQAPERFQLLVTNQGCADRGLCYPPMQRGIEARLKGFGGDGSVRVLRPSETALGPSAVTLPDARGSAPSAAGNDRLDGALRDGRLWPVVGVFFVAGMLLSLTPCVLPMLPILSSIIVGQGARVSRGRGFGLAVSYSLGMAMVYTAIGIAAGLAGVGLAALLQHPWVLFGFAAGLVALALSMFGLYELRLPTAFNGRLADASQHLPAGRFIPVFVMGGLSALIVSPCVAAPLAGALVYLSQTGNVVLGGSALFSLAAGMSVPLLLVGASAGALMPRAGAWMVEVQRFFGLLLIGVALWTVQSVLNESLTLALWGALAISAGVMLVSQGQGRHDGAWARSLWRRCLAAVLAAIGMLQIAGGASGGADPFQPLAHLRPRVEGDPNAAPLFITLRSVAEFDAALRNAGRPVVLDFYADWCVSCKEMDRFTYADPAVQRKLRGAMLLKADVTANNADDRELLKRFGLFGPPGTIFFDETGREIAAARIVGFQSSTQFLKTLQAAGL